MSIFKGALMKPRGHLSHGSVRDTISYPLFVPRIRKGTHLKEFVFVFPEAEGRREYGLFVPRIRKGTHLKEFVFPEAEGRREYGFLKVCAFRILGTNNG